MHRTAFFAACSLLGHGLSAAAFSWADTKYLFAFGDSYTASGYNVSNGILSPDPIIGWADGYTWVEFLVHDYNQTNTKIFNFAYGGATIDNAVIQGSAVSLKDQILSEFGDNFVPAPPAKAPWTSADSLFAVWIGINDMDISFQWTNVSQETFRAQLLDEWEGLVKQLYTWGARNFVFLNVPPVYRAPAWTVQNSNITSQLKAAEKDFNRELIMHTTNLTATYTDASFMFFNASGIYANILDDPAPLGIKNTTAYCPGYAAFTEKPPSTTTYLPECGIPVLEYFFLDFLHPTGTVHKQIAQKLATFLEAA